MSEGLECRECHTDLQGGIVCHSYGSYPQNTYVCCKCETTRHQHLCCNSTAAAAAWREVLTNEQLKIKHKQANLTTATSLIDFSQRLEDTKKLSIVIEGGSQSPISLQIPAFMLKDLKQYLQKACMDGSYLLHRDRL